VRDRVNSRLEHVPLPCLDHLDACRAENLRVSPHFVISFTLFSFVSFYIQMFKSFRAGNIVLSNVVVTESCEVLNIL
jgi:hypothetical protein